jgi:hypothetical protein
MTVSNTRIPVPGSINNHLIRMMILYSKGQDPLNKDTTLYLATLFKHEVDAFSDPMVHDILKDRRFVHIDMGSYFVNQYDFDSMYGLYLCVNADCAFPPHYLVTADSMEEAYSEFLNETDSCLIEEPDLKDYDEDSLTYDDTGRPMDTDSLHVSELSIMLISFVDYADLKQG